MLLTMTNKGKDGGALGLRGMEALRRQSRRPPMEGEETASHAAASSPNHSFAGALMPSFFSVAWCRRYLLAGIVPARIQLLMVDGYFSPRTIAALETPPIALIRSAGVWISSLMPHSFHVP